VDLPADLIQINAVALTSFYRVDIPNNCHTPACVERPAARENRDQRTTRDLWI